MNVIIKIKNFFSKKAESVRKLVCRAFCVTADCRGENYVDSGVKIPIAIVIGGLLLALLYSLFGDTIMPTVTQRVEEMFNYAG